MILFFFILIIMNITKPLLKWVGGKTQIIYTLLGNFPVEINNYHEIFLGGGSVLFALLSYAKHGLIHINGNIYAYDVNEPLIYIYKNIQTNHNELYEILQSIIIDFNECGDGPVNRKPANIEEAKTSKENYYYWVRSQYNKLTDKKTMICSAMFIFLNKTCFRGVFRVGPNGFNVPYGNYKNPEIINKDHLDEIHNLIQNVIFECCDFSLSLSLSIEENDFVYLDPPYAPENSKSFVGYTENGFNIENHQKLFELIHMITDKRNIKIIMNNADVSLVRDNFTTDKYNIIEILCKRSINSKNPEAKAKEVIIRNY
uniref:site-specific DNA-methyltransferase (adenine-specific) n=1 Tax=viral metagenome TaxID=1070528 RepID=A0A6C0LIC3_9ZZZZ